MEKVCLVSLGCAKNLVDSEMMLGFLKKDGFGFSTEPSESEIIVVNTCGFLEASRKESIEQILEMARYKEEGVCKVLVASGCLTQKHGEELAKEMPEVDLFIGTGEFDRLAEYLRKRFASPPPRSPSLIRRGKGEVVLSARQILPDPDLPRILSTPKHYSYVKISEGCSHICSFCTIPSIRGRLKSRTLDSVVREVEQFVVQGVKEFNLIAQDLNEYGRDLKDGTNLAALIEALDKVPGDFWLRPLYMYPLEFNDRLITALADSEHAVKYVDMPLQHISERVLLSMKRGSPGRYVRQVLGKLKARIPELALRTTFIVGYPGETEEEFQELCDFVSETEFDRVGVFKFSIEEGTAAATLPDQVPQETKDERYERLMALQMKISRKKNKALVGKTFKALCEGPMPGNSGFFQARLASQAPEIDGITLLAGQHKAGEFVNVKILKTADYDLIAEASA
ncbi:MAG TPA: 30S ribosomal protein S12 methylthiotransferase RimO [bacterium]|nr:30S ribosomal protein S12 methylthiotransferase RimO [bacterium]